MGSVSESVAQEILGGLATVHSGGQAQNTGCGGIDLIALVPSTTFNTTPIVSSSIKIRPASMIGVWINLTALGSNTTLAVLVEYSDDAETVWYRDIRLPIPPPSGSIIYAAATYLYSFTMIATGAILIPLRNPVATRMRITITGDHATAAVSAVTVGITRGWGNSI